MSSKEGGDLKGSIRFSCPGKIILFGEHSVVYNKRAIALSIGLGTQILVDFKEKEKIVLDLSSFGLSVSWTLTEIEDLFFNRFPPKAVSKKPRSLTDQEKTKYESFLGAGSYEGNSKLCLEMFLHLYSNILPHPVPFRLKCASDLAIGAGLGSSATFGVCLSAVLLNVASQLSGDPFMQNGERISPSALESIREWAFITETMCHGTPSGIDNTICTYGGGISFKSGHMVKIKVPHLKVILVDTGVSRSTKTLVEKVREKHNRYPLIIKPILDAMDNLAESASQIFHCQDGVSDISPKDLKTLEDLIEMNHSLLTALGVSHPSLDKIVSIAKSFDMAGKLTGAGGGGFAVILSHGKEMMCVEDCKKALMDQGFNCWETELGAPGICSLAANI